MFVQFCSPKFSSYVYTSLFHEGTLKLCVLSHLDDVIRNFVRYHYSMPLYDRPPKDITSWSTHFNQWPTHIVSHIPLDDSVTKVRQTNMIRDAYPFEVISEVCPEFVCAETYFTISLVRINAHHTPDPLCDMFILFKVCLVRHNDEYKFVYVSCGFHDDLFSEFTAWLDLWIQKTQQLESLTRDAIHSIMSQLSLDDDSTWGLSKRVTECLGLSVEI